MRSYILALLATLTTLLSLHPVKAQDQYGLPFILNYSAREFKGSSTVWTVTQDHRGLMYFGMSGEIKEFDGKMWHSLGFGSNTVRSMDHGTDNKTYVGLKEDFGYFFADSVNGLHYVSLFDKIPKEHRDFRDIWNTHFTRHGVMFFSFNKAFQYVDDTIIVHEVRFSAHLAFEADGDLYAITKRDGLKKFNGKKFAAVNGGEWLVGQKVFFVDKIDERTILVYSGSGGFYFINTLTGETEDFKVDNEQELIDARVYHGVRVSDRIWAFATLENGVYVIDHEGNVIGHFTTENGLISNNVKYLFVDEDKGLWAATAKGISFIDISLPLAFYSTKQGLLGYPRDVGHFGNQTLIATGNGVYRYNANAKAFSETFERLPGYDGQVWEIKAFRGKILAATSDGLFEVVNDRVSRVFPFNTVFQMLNSETDSNLLYLGLTDGLAICYIENGRLATHQYFEFKDVIQTMIEGPGGHLLFVTRLDSSMVIEPSSFRPPYELKMKGIRLKADQLRGSERSRFNGSQLLYRKEGGIRLSKEGKVISTKFPRLDQRFLDPRFQLLSFAQDFQSGSIWCKGQVDGDYIFFEAYETDSSVYVPTYYPGVRISEKLFNTGQPKVVHGKLWLAGAEGIVTVNLERTQKFQKSFNLLIRNALYQDTSIYLNTNIKRRNGRFQIPYNNNQLRFEFCAQAYQNPSWNQYQVQLKGYENEWSHWSSDPFKEYANLPEGDYVFRVRARNIYHVICEEQQFKFTILPPWYRTWWAYTCYGLVLAIFAFLINKLSTYRLRKAKISLEQKVLERTKIIDKEKRKLLTLTAELENKNKDITDSIVYAKRIQQSILPPLDQFDTIFTDSFVLYEPRDIVSGDFYWYTFTNDVCILAVGDCTGHGVPGAFMSMISSTLISQIVTKADINAPQDAMNILEKDLRATLTRGNDEGMDMNDGLDLSIMAYHTKTNWVQYAGAKRPMYHIRNGKLSIFDGSIHAIGGKMAEGKEFTGHDLYVEKGDNLYIFSDGYADQFGGPKFKKFKIKRLQNMLIEISELPMREQKKILMDRFDEWRGEYEQVDDLLFVGIKVM